jgi:hypothetical protein
VRLSPINCGPCAYARGDYADLRSEGEFGSQLNDATSALEGRDEIGRTNVHPARHEQIGMIEDIVKFSAKTIELLALIHRSDILISTRNSTEIRDKVSVVITFDR